MALSVTRFIACSNSACIKFMVTAMHETARRLLEAGIANGERSFTAIARRFGASDQSATNWKTRGVPSAVIIQASSDWHIDPKWLAAEDDAHPLAFARASDAAPSRPVAPASKVAEPAVMYGCELTEDERRLVAGFRAAKNGLRRAMLLLADECNEMARNRASGIG